MGFDCGFDFYPPLKRTKANQEQYELFLRQVLDTYGPRDGDEAEHGDGDSVVRVNADSEESYIEFEVGEYPHLPAGQWFGDRAYFWHEMNEFGPSVRQRGCYNWNDIRTARKNTREHKQQAEEGELDETEIQVGYSLSREFSIEKAEAMHGARKARKTWFPEPDKGITNMYGCSISPITKLDVRHCRRAIERIFDAACAAQLEVVGRNNVLERRRELPPGSDKYGARI
ncbi:hypothetical protein DL98DRAFT_540546 [Cadophora sp. DSE1049]|nr:hypothetical protein DL98DRAFT_540546 [Cadophora sp. DSE1049]